jgi:hypothetical protein
MQFQINVKRWLLAFPPMLLVHTLFQFYAHRVYMLRQYLHFHPVFYTANTVSLPMLFLASLIHVFLFLLLYAQVATVFPGLRGGLMFALLVGLLLYLPLALLHLAFISAPTLIGVFGLWQYIDLLTNLMMGAIAGTLYQPSHPSASDK